MKSDRQVQRDVIAELNWEPSINATRIGVEVSDGVVTLAGHVGSYAEKWDAERAAQRVVGVRALAVEMEVTLPGSSRRDDVDMARSAQNVLQWLANLPTDAVKVKVENGWVTLSGDVDWEYQRQAAAGAVRYLMGVTGVSDQITIVPNISTSAVKSEIESALKRRAKVDVLHQFLASRLTPPIHPRPKQKFAAGHERDEPLVTANNRKAPLVEGIVRLEQNRHDVCVEQQNSHFGRVLGWRRISRISLRNASTSSGQPRSLYGNEDTGGFAPGIGTVRSGKLRGSTTILAMLIV